jgi:hypothetical protein
VRKPEYAKRGKRRIKLRLQSSLAPNSPIDRSPINTQKKDDKEVVPKMQALSPVECFAAVAARKVKYSRKFL